MIRINLLKKQMPSRKPEKAPGRRRRPIAAPGKGVLYALALLIALGIAFYAYLPAIVNYLYYTPPPQALVPAPVIPDTPAVRQEIPPQDTVKPEEAEEPVSDIVIERAPEQPPPQAQAAPQAKPEPIVLAGEASAEQLINAYLALRRSLRPGSSYGMLSVERNTFLAEILEPSANAASAFAEKIRNQLPGSNPSLANSRGSGRNIVRGTYPVRNASLSNDASILTVDTFIQRLGQLARRHNLQFASREIGARTLENGISGISVIAKFTGTEERAASFLAALRRTPLNMTLRKITGMPRGAGGSSMVIQLALTMRVLIPE